MERIGSFGGIAVYIDDSLPPGRVELRHAGLRPVNFSIDHPYIQGTAFERAARHALKSASEVARETLASENEGN